MKTIEELAQRIFIDDLVNPVDAISPGDWLTHRFDGSSAWSCGHSFQVHAIEESGVHLKINGFPIYVGFKSLCFPLDPQVRTERQQSILETLYNAQLQLFILAASSGFIGCRGVIGKSETYEKLLWYRRTLTEAAEDLKAMIAPDQNRFEVVMGELPEAVQLIGIEDNLPRWSAVVSDPPSKALVTFDRLIELLNEEPDFDYQIGTLQQLLQIAIEQISEQKQESALNEIIEIISNRLPLDKDEIRDRLLGNSVSSTP